jgi:hypothetical protein
MQMSASTAINPATKLLKISWNSCLLEDNRLAWRYAFCYNAADNVAPYLEITDNYVMRSCRNIYFQKASVVFIANINPGETLRAALAAPTGDLY